MAVKKEPGPIESFIGVSVMIIIVVFLFKSCGTDEPAATTTTKEAPIQSEFKTVTLDKVVSVTDFYSTLNNKSAVGIYFGGDQERFVDVTIYRSNVKQGYHVRSLKDSQKEMSVSGKWEGFSGYLNDNGIDTTSFDLTIESIDRKKGEAIFLVSGLISDAPEKKFLDIRSSRITVSGKDFKYLISNPKPE